MTVRKRSELETIQHLQWLLKQKDVDWDTLNYPTAAKWVALDGERVLAFNHTHLGLVVESVAFNPDSTPKQRLESCIDLVNTYSEMAKSDGMREIYYISSDARTDEAAMKHLGFQPVKCYRKRL